MKRFIFATFWLLFFASPVVQAWDVSLGVFRPLDKVQNRYGEARSDRYLPQLAVGHVFGSSPDWAFAPQLGYVMYRSFSEDRYASYKVETLYLLYDFRNQLEWPSRDFFWRIGIFNFMKKIKGEGGSVTVPNGSSTTTAYRPEGEVTSYSGGIDLGLEWILSSGGTTFREWGIKGVLFLFEPLNKQKFTMAYQLGVTAQF